MNFEQRDSSLQVKIGLPFPDFTLTNTAGDTFSAQALKGKITVINFWFESCAPCIAEIDALNQLFLTFKDNPDFRFLSFTTDSPETAKTAVKKHAILFDVLPIARKECERLFCTEFPTNIILDQYGKVAYIKAGLYPKDTHIRQMELLTAFLLTKNNWRSPYTYTVSSSILPDSLPSFEPLTIEDLYRMGLLKEEDRDTVPIVGRKYMDFKAATLTGKNISQERLPGKITLINIWNYYCSPCVAEFEFFNNLYLHYKNNSDFQLFTFTCDTEEEAKEAILMHNLLYDIACVSREECYRLNYNSGFPTIIIIDRKGFVSYYKHGGYIEREKVANYFKELEGEIDNLLKN